MGGGDSMKYKNCISTMHFPTDNSFVTSISFRNKQCGWKAYGMMIIIK